MIVLAVGEMWLHAAFEHGPRGVTLAFGGGALVYATLAPLLPEPDVGRWGIKNDAIGAAGVRAAGRPARGSGTRRGPPRAAKTPPSPSPAGARAPPTPAALLRLGIVNAIVMTAHNLPEGASVAFASYTPLGPLVAAAIAAHNLAEGICVAAPIYAATGSRAAAVALAAASGMSEPLGAALALAVARPSASSPDQLPLVLAAAGGVMAAVCGADLLPSGVQCGAPRRLVGGVVVGAALMGWTLWVGV